MFSSCARSTISRVFAVVCSPARVSSSWARATSGSKSPQLCRHLGLDVTVIEMTERAMSRVVAPPLSAFYAEQHAAHGVQLHFNTTVSAFAGDGAVREVVLHRRSAFPGGYCGGRNWHPAGDRHCGRRRHCLRQRYRRETSTAAPVRSDVYAAGDCTNHPSPRYGRRVRLESVDHAFEHARSAAANMLGKAVVHDKVPWFWSDQYDLKLLIVGLSHGYDECVVRGDPATRSFSVCYLRGGELIAVDAVNSAKDYMAARKLIAERARLNVARIADATIQLKDAH